ncbi:tagaturonate reductase [Chryseobacterium sp. Ch-15]|uniref:Tagaturonate reductase n=1 Tax=Chryseobacterium muglaense TaxID=2893752 RepID=A0A9Q3YR80_9FLAO|nr:tagaturonate reductase [Chryseobacterium muglaense]MBD3903482.1 tagaturonate reductase [Chryseobacterium muglaense]MCC9034554.1 tagaturonate reductase [Chryseobacterium muglaense]MCM2552817.1 tagaturonate reductase [Chryseobacterium muglaense]
MENQTKQKLNRQNSGLDTKLPIKIVQFGGGNFMRGFTDYVIDKMNKEAGFNAGIVNLQATPNGSIQKMENQDNLYTLFNRGIKKDEIIDQKQIISSIQKSVNPYGNYEEFLALAKEEELEFIFSNTTETGIAYDENETSYEGPHKNFPAKVVVLLHERYKHFNGATDKGLRIIPCELIEDNAFTLRNIILKYAQLWNLEEGFVQWINQSNYFHNTLVDRIVPGYPKDDVESYEDQLDYEDQNMVVSETFLLFVIQEAGNLNERIPFNKINEQILVVDDIQPYRLRKVRILNGGHTLMLAPAILSGKELVKEAIDDQFIGKFLSDAIFNEVNQTLGLDEAELKDFAEEVFDRFRNPFIKHHLASIALYFVSKFKVRVIPSLLTYVETNGKLPLNLTFSLASLIRFYQGSFGEKALPLNDEEGIITKFKEIWMNEDYEKVAELALSEISFWDTDLTKVEGLKTAIAKALYEIDHNDTEIAYNNFVQFNS